MRSDLVKWAVAVLMIFAWPNLAAAGHVLWSNSGTGNWNVGGNWAGGAVPGSVIADEAEIGEGAGNGGTAILNSAVPNVSNLRLGEGAGETGHLEIQTGGSLTTTSGDLLLGDNGTAIGTITITDGDLTVNNGRLELGRNGTGTINQSGGTFTVNNSHVVMGRYANAVSTIDLSGGTLQTAGTTANANVRFHMAWDNAGSKAYLNISNDGALVTNKHLAANVYGGFLVAEQGTAEITLSDSGSITVNSGLDGGEGMSLGRHGTSSATMTQTDGSVTINNGPLRIARYDNATGIYNISAGTLSTAGTSGDRNIYLAYDGAGTHAELNVSGSAVVAPYDNLQIAGQGTGTVNQTGGTVTLDDRYVIVGRYGTSTGVYNISDGIVQTVGNGTKSGANRRFHIAWDSADTQGTLDVSGTGQVIVNRDRVNGYTGLLVGNLGTGVVNVGDNGSITVYGGGDGEGGMSLGLNGNASGTVNQTGGTVTIYDNYVMIGRRGTATGVYNISTGTLQTGGLAGTNNRIYLGWDSAGATGELHLSGNAHVTTNKDNLNTNSGGLYAGEYGTAEITIADNASLTINAGADGEGMSLGRRGTSSATVTQTGGTVTVNDQYFIMGRYDHSSGTYDISGGVLKTAGTIAGDSRRMHLAWDSVDATAQMNVSGNGQVIVNADNVSGYTGFQIAALPVLGAEREKDGLQASDGLA